MLHQDGVSFLTCFFPLSHLLYHFEDIWEILQNIREHLIPLSWVIMIHPLRYKVSLS